LRGFSSGGDCACYPRLVPLAAGISCIPEHSCHPGAFTGHRAGTLPWPPDALLSLQVALDLSQHRGVAVRRVLNTEADVVRKFGVTGFPSCYLLFRNGSCAVPSRPLSSLPVLSLAACPQGCPSSTVASTFFLQEKLGSALRGADTSTSQEPGPGMLSLRCSSGRSWGLLSAGPTPPQSGAWAGNAVPALQLREKLGSALRGADTST
ncbi:hypothetical protein P7K49_037894, partial [Saguinus oedipus]